MIRMMIGLAAVLLVVPFPATWMLMLFLGNVGLGISYWGALPLGILVSSMIGGLSTPAYLQR